jgi:hypothetical protein
MNHYRILIAGIVVLTFLKLMRRIRGVIQRIQNTEFTWVNNWHCGS